MNKKIIKRVIISLYFFIGISTLITLFLMPFTKVGDYMIGFGTRIFVIFFGIFMMFGIPTGIIFAIYLTNPIYDWWARDE